VWSDLDTHTHDALEQRAAGPDELWRQQ